MWERIPGQGGPVFFVCAEVDFQFSGFSRALFNLWGVLCVAEKPEAGTAGGDCAVKFLRETAAAVADGGLL